MKRNRLCIVAGLLVLLGTGCTLSLAQTPTPLPTFAIPSLLPTQFAQLTSPAPTAEQPAGSPTSALPSITPASTLPVPSSTPAAPTGPSINPGTPSGPYGVVLVTPNDVLNIRKGPGANNDVIGRFPATATNVMRTGPWSRVGGDMWVEVQNPAGGTGWVNANFLMEYVAPATFCADERVTALITTLKNALNTKDGKLLGTLISPLHGADVRLWRNGTSANYNQAEAEWVFTSTYVINWGPAAGSGEDTIGTFHEVVLPRLTEVLNAGYQLGCNDASKAGAVVEAWPVEYANVNFYAIHKPGSPGVDLDWRTWLMGVEYASGQPTIFALIHFQWEP